jgi:hypothetical protein
MQLRHCLALGCLSLLLACTASYTSSTPPITSGTSGASGASGAITATVAASADAARMHSDVAWLADDARQGRRAGSEDAKLVAKWLGERLHSLGLEGAGDKGDYFQYFDVPLAARVGPNSLVSARLANSSPPALEFKQVLPLFCSEGASAEGALSFRGFGIESLDQQWDDFGGGELSGSIVVLLRGTPPASELLPAKPAASGEVEHTASFEASGSIFLKVMNAKRHGAAGVILLQEAGSKEPLAFDASQAARAGIPALSAPRGLFEQLVGSARANELCAKAEHRDHGDFGAPDPSVGVRIAADVHRDKGSAINVLARLKGADPLRTVVIGAHYDHLGLGGEGSLAPELTGQVHNGADDNASGTAAVLEMARVLSLGPKPAGDVVFALWSGEELGLLGSEYWCAHPSFEIKRVRANLNLDMVGRARAPGDTSAKPMLIVLGAGTATAFETWLAPAGEAVGLTVQVNRSGFGTGGSDHMSFMKVKIPVLHFFTGVHADYHKPSDDSDKIDSDSMARIASLGIDLVRRMQAEQQLPWNDSEPEIKKGGEERAQVASAASSKGFSVWFGSVPDYAFEGPGVLLQGTSSGSPAEKAGMLAGDILLQVGDVRIDTIHDFSYALKIYKPGDVVATRFSRKGVEQTVRITLATKAAR